MNEPLTTPYECIDPPLGEQIWRLEQPAGVEPALRAALEAHLSACDACRLLVHLDAAARDLARNGRLAAGTDSGRTTRRPVHRIRPGAQLLAGLALAACFVLMVVLPPRPAGESLSARGADQVRFERPVEGEVLATGRPVLRWTPVAGANLYGIELRDQEGRPIWHGESASPEIQVPTDVRLAPGRRYRALLSTSPPDLVLPGHVSVAFWRDSPGRMILHRLRWADPLLQVAAGFCVAVIVLATIRRRTTNR